MKSRVCTVVLCLGGLLACHPDAPLTEPGKPSSAEPPTHSTADVEDTHAADATPPPLVADVDGPDTPMTPSLPTEPGWAEACQTAQAWLDEPMRTCQPVGASETARAPYLLHLRTSLRERRVLVHDGEVVVERGPDALVKYLKAIGFPSAAPAAAILWDLLQLFEVLPADWRMGFVPEGRWADAEGWMRSTTLHHDRSSPPFEVEHGAHGATLRIHRTLLAGQGLGDPLPTGSGGAGKDRHLRLTLGFDAAARLQKPVVEVREGGRWRRMK